MRQIEREVIGAFVIRRPKAKGNTNSTGDTLALHGNVIAAWRGSDLYVTLAGWPTPTTRSRLNALTELMGWGSLFYQSKRRQYVDGRFTSGPFEIEPDAWYRLRPIDSDLALGEKPVISVETVI